MARLSPCAALVAISYIHFLTQLIQIHIVVFDVGEIAMTDTIYMKKQIILFNIISQL